ncbi:MAG: hypothetical protein ABI873_16015 [Marmoricola sp.]
MLVLQHQWELAEVGVVAQEVVAAQVGGTDREARDTGEHQGWQPQRGPPPLHGEEDDHRQRGQRGEHDGRMDDQRVKRHSVDTHG